MGNSFEDDFNFIFAKTGKARAPRPGSNTSAAAGGSKRALTPRAQRRALLGVTKRKPQVMVKITSFGKSSKGVADHLDYISRKGENELFDDQGDELHSLADRAGREPRDVLDDLAARLSDAPAVADGQAVKRRPRERVTMNLMLSMPEGTDTGAFEMATRDFVSETFSKNDHVFAFHDDRGHYHAHIVVSLQGDDGKWLNPKKADLQKWRENFAEALESRGIAADATPAYSRGKGKGGYRRDMKEASKRGTKRRPDPSPSYDAEAEAGAIQKRAQAWSRIGEHYAKAGDIEAADAITDYLREQFDHHPAPAPAPTKAQEQPKPIPTPTIPERPKEPTKAQETPAPVQVSPEAARVSKEFADLAMKRETQQKGYGNLNDAWRYDTPADLRRRVDDYNKLPQEQRPAELVKIAADPSTDALLKQRAREQSRGK
jgi:hypothetical protein